MQYREPINVRDIVAELRRLWFLPLAVGAAFAVLFVALQVGSGGSFEQRVDIVGTDVNQLANALRLPIALEKFDADVVGRREQSKLEVLNRQSPNSDRVRILASPQTSTLSVFGSASSPGDALDVAKRYSNGIVDSQRAAADLRISATKQMLEGQLNRIQTELDSTASGDTSDRVLLLVDRSSTIQLLEGLSTFDQVVRGGVHDAELVGSPTKVSRSSLGTYATLGALLGLVIGCAFVVLRRTMSPAIFGEADLERYGSAVPVLADITGPAGANRGVFAALVSACAHGESAPDRVLGVLLTSVEPGAIPESFSSAVLDSLPAFGLAGALSPPDSLDMVGSVLADDQFHVVVINEAARESSAAVACAARLASTVVVVRRRKTPIASTLEAVELMLQANAQLRGIVIVD